ncbi:MAG: 16S rRNA (uracil(1498)-N(3))-methyltransferase [Nocardioidaceae bacterium]|nr:16S rRNA (uracil(1498)-N(3))-methyltransferase [Nocardioidaceae bacterium]
MSLPVFVVDLDGVRSGDRVVLDGDEGRHAATVKRLRVGEQLVLTDGLGTSAPGTVAETAKSSLVVSVSSVSDAPRPLPSVTVVQAIPKGDRGELAVEVLTEIGADRIVPWAASRSVAVWRGDRAAKSLAKWRATARAAAKQARRVWFPEVAPLASTTEVAALIEAADLAVVLHEDAGERIADLPLDGVASILVVVGPEGGVSEDELAAFEKAHVVGLGSEVLRTSTAGVAGVAALLSRTARWR